MALTFFRPRGDVKANWEAANPILKEREMAIEWETTIGVGQPRIKFGKAGGTTHYNDTDYAVLPLKYNTKDGWATDNPILAVGEMGIEWETTIGEGAVCIKFGNGTTAWNSLEYASTGRLKEIIEPETKNTPVAVGDTLPMIAGKVNSQQDFLKTKLGYERLDALAASLSGLSNQDFVGIMDFINQKKFDKSSVYNGVDSTNTELALAASQGKTLHDQITTLNSNLGYLGEIREAYLSTAITPQSGQTYTIGSLSLETGKWLLFGATLAGGDLIIDGNIISRLNGRNANTSSDISMRAFAISNGGIVNLKLVSNGFGMLHADKTYCGLTAVRIG